MNEDILEIYTDGACRYGEGGWAAILIHTDKVVKIGGHENNTTSNRMELKAAIEALKYVKEQCNIIVYTDSQYLKKGITEWINLWLNNDWNKGKVNNKDLWADLHKLSSNKCIKWRWVKAHRGNPMNEAVDLIAKSMINNKTSLLLTNY